MRFVFKGLSTPTYDYIHVYNTCTHVYISRPTRCTKSYNVSLFIIKCSTCFGLFSPSSGATFWSCISQLVQARRTGLYRLERNETFPLYCKWCGYTLIPGLYSESVQYPQFLCHSFGYGNSLAHGQTLCALCNIHQRNHTFKLIFWPTFPTLDVFYMFRTLWVQHQEDRCRGSFCMVCLRTKQPFTILSS